MSDFVISREEYLRNPCFVSSIPYWKAQNLQMPPNLHIVHHCLFDSSLWMGLQVERYFRLSHSLGNVVQPTLPAGFSVTECSLGMYAAHISYCYPSLQKAEEVLAQYLTHPVYRSELWLAIRDERTGAIVATGIGEYDPDMREGVLEWIQVLPEYRRMGLGSFVVRELLWRMHGIADFATVSGRCDNPTNPEALYRACGFSGSDVWHILRKV